MEVLTTAKLAREGGVNVDTMLTIRPHKQLTLKSEVHALQLANHNAQRKSVISAIYPRGKDSHSGYADLTYKL